jgi:hypothetical protein
MTTNSPIGGFQGRVPLISAVAVVAVLIAQAVVLAVVSVIVSSTAGLQIPGPTLLGVLSPLIQYVPFGVGVLVALRYLAPVLGADSWGRVVGRSALAAALGAAAVFVVAAVASTYVTIAVDGNILGYSFINATVDHSNLAFEVVGAFATGATSFVQWLPIVVVVCACQKLWLASRAAVLVTANVSDAETL